MKEYPSISRDFFEFPAYIFDKLDGSNIRVEYSRKQGWYKFGKRHGLVDASDPLLGQCVETFKRDWDESLTKLAVDSRWDKATLFFEFHGPGSFAGQHVDSDPKTLTLFDASVDKKGILLPNDFLKTFKGMNHAAFLGHMTWTRGLLERVRNNDLEGVSFEGVVGKGGERHSLILRKAKTSQWLDKVRSLYAPEQAEKIINS